LERILFMPAGDPWQKSERTISPALDRVEMLRLAIDDSAGFELDLREVIRLGRTYTIDTLESFDESEDLSLVVGADAAAGIPSWHRADEIVGRARILVVPRTGVEESRVLEAVPGAWILDMEPVDISATEIRRRVAAGLSVDSLVTSEVAVYIASRGLYADAVEDDMVGDSSDPEE
jgi:nicotinate-nucleotide adenylyltransferase